MYLFESYLAALGWAYDNARGDCSVLVLYDGKVRQYQIWRQN